MLEKNNTMALEITNMVNEAKELLLNMKMKIITD